MKRAEAEAQNSTSAGPKAMQDIEDSAKRDLDPGISEGGQDQSWNRNCF